MGTPAAPERTLRFQIDPLEGESLRACTAIVQSAVTSTRLAYVLLLLYVAVAAVAYLLTPATWMATFFIGLGTVLATSATARVATIVRLRRIQRLDPHALETRFVEVSPDGVRCWCAHIDARYAWADFTGVIENSEFFLFVRPNGDGASIPKRIVDAGCAAALRGGIRAWSPDHGAALAADNLPHEERGAGEVLPAAAPAPKGPPVLDARRATGILVAFIAAQFVAGLLVAIPFAIFGDATHRAANAGANLNAVLPAVALGTLFGGLVVLRMARTSFPGSLRLGALAPLGWVRATRGAVVGAAIGGVTLAAVQALVVVRLWAPAPTHTNEAFATELRLGKNGLAREPGYRP